MDELEEQIEEKATCCGLSLPKISKSDIGWLLVGGGVVTSLIALLRREQHAAEWVLPVGLIAAGGSILINSRQGQMEAAEASILSELDKLDPIARAQVLKSVAAEEVSRLPGLGDSD